MRRHEANSTALVAGLLFLGIGAYGIAVTPDRLADSLRWLWPILLHRARRRAPRPAVALTARERRGRRGRCRTR